MFFTLLHKYFVTEVIGTLMIVLSAELKERINAFLRRLYKYGFTHSIIDIEHLLALSDRKLFRKMQQWEHCLYRLLLPGKDNDIELRPARHDFLLHICN